jgi:hypothetical protein
MPPEVTDVSWTGAPGVVVGADTEVEEVGAGELLEVDKLVETVELVEEVLVELDILDVEVVHTGAEAV